MMKMDINRLGTSFGYMVWSLKNKPQSEWINSANAVVEHHFDNHIYCGPWCKQKQQTQQQKEAGARYYRSVMKDAELYATLKRIISRFITIKRLEEVAHGFDTQINESFNNTASWFAPENKVYCGSQSLTNRLLIAIGINSIGVNGYFTRLFVHLGMTMPPCVAHFLAFKGIRQNKMARKRKLTKTKKKHKNKWQQVFGNHRQMTRDWMRS
jgi:hypothetical protein